MELDNKTEQIAALEREVISKEQQTIATEQQLRDVQHKYQWVIKIDKNYN